MNARIFKLAYTRIEDGKYIETMIDLDAMSNLTTIADKVNAGSVTAKAIDGASIYLNNEPIGKFDIRDNVLFYYVETINDIIKRCTLNQLACLMFDDMRKNGYIDSNQYNNAFPYLVAMSKLNRIEDNYYHDSGKSVVLYLLSNLTAYRGTFAKLVKSELKRRAK